MVNTAGETGKDSHILQSKYNPPPSDRVMHYVFPHDVQADVERRPSSLLLSVVLLLKPK